MGGLPLSGGQERRQSPKTGRGGFQAPPPQTGASLTAGVQQPRYHRAARNNDELPHPLTSGNRSDGLFLSSRGCAPSRPSLDRRQPLGKCQVGLARALPEASSVPPSPLPADRSWPLAPHGVAPVASPATSPPVGTVGVHWWPAATGPGTTRRIGRRPSLVVGRFLGIVVPHAARGPRPGCRGATGRGVAGPDRGSGQRGGGRGPPGCGPHRRPRGGRTGLRRPPDGGAGRGAAVGQR